MQWESLLSKHGNDGIELSFCFSLPTWKGSHPGNKPSIWAVLLPCFATAASTHAFLVGFVSDFMYSFDLQPGAKSSSLVKDGKIWTKLLDTVNSWLGVCFPRRAEAQDWEAAGNLCKNGGTFRKPTDFVKDLNFQKRTTPVMARKSDAI